MRELPEFEEIANNYADDVTVIAIGDYYESRETVLNFIPSEIGSQGKTDWSDWTLTFAHDVEQQDGSSVYELLGGVNAYPMTLILDENGVISFIREGSLSYEELESQVLTILNNAE